MDFTYNKLMILLDNLMYRDYQILPFKYFNKLTIEKYVFLRHDVDRTPENSLKLAELEKSININGTYYFRVVDESYNLRIMNKIAELGHEIGYHYEDVDLVLKSKKTAFIKNNGEVDKESLIDFAYSNFCQNLEMLRKNFDITTICMHGSPKARYDNKIIWQKYNYKELGLIAEPYFDVDFNKLAYFTDTGRRWNGNKYSIRDKVVSKYKFDFKTTQQIINNIAGLPDKLMFTIHPQRWNNSFNPWVKELIVQNIKNVIKHGLLLIRN